MDKPQASPPADAFVRVDDPVQAKLLSDSAGLRYFEPFVARECTVTQAAREADCTPDAMLYRVRTFVNAGLLVVTREEKRAGRPIKHYRSSHDAYFIPFEVSPFAELEERSRAVWREREPRLMRASAAFIRSLGQEGQRIYRSGRDGEVWRDSAAAPGEGGGALGNLLQNITDPEQAMQVIANYRGPVGSDFATELVLEDDDARELLGALLMLWRQYQDKATHTAKGKRYHFSATFLPAEND